MKLRGMTVFYLLSPVAIIGAIAWGASSAASRPPVPVKVSSAPHKARSAAKAEPVDPEVAARGPKPHTSAWDGLAEPVYRYLHARLNDPYSMKVESALPVMPSGDKAWFQRVSYRAKNALGAYVLKTQDFVMRGDEVLRVDE